MENKDILRKLTPREKERLQGFPQDWTLIIAALEAEIAQINIRLAFTNGGDTLGEAERGEMVARAQRLSGDLERATQVKTRALALISKKGRVAQGEKIL